MGIRSWPDNQASSTTLGVEGCWGGRRGASSCGRYAHRPSRAWGIRNRIILGTTSGSAPGACQDGWSLRQPEALIFNSARHSRGGAHDNSDGVVPSPSEPVASARGD